MENIFNRCSASVIKSIMQAQDLSRTLARNYCGTENLLLGLLIFGDPEIVRAFEQEGLDATKAQEIIQKFLISGDEAEIVGVDIPFTPRCEQTLRLAFRFASEDHSETIEGRHLALALLQAETGGVFEILSHLNVDRGHVRDNIVK